MEILQFEDLGDTSVISECSLGVNLVFDIFFYVASDSSPLYKIWKQSDHYLWRYCILKIWGIRVSFSCERSCSSPRRVSNFNSNVPQGGIYPHINFERDPLNIFRVRALTSSGSTGGGGGGRDAKTIISLNTSFGDIIKFSALYYCILVVTLFLCTYKMDDAISKLLININKILIKFQVNTNYIHVCTIKYTEHLLLKNLLSTKLEAIYRIILKYTDLPSISNNSATPLWCSVSNMNLEKRKIKFKMSI